jgi:uncharacterized protein YndB with AHSA1/START domain
MTMTDRGVVHATFVVERRFDASPARVWAAFADPAQKGAWSCHETWTMAEMTFAVGGREVAGGSDAGGPYWAFDGTYLDIVDGERFVVAYTMSRDGVRVSASIITWEIFPDPAGARLVFTDQGAYLDGLADPAEREAGSGMGLDNLAAFLRAAA